MTASRRASLLATCDQWVRASHANTAVVGGPAALTLSWHEPEDEPFADSGPCPARGLAVDRLCRVYRLTAHRVERVAVGRTAEGLDYVALPQPVTIVGSDPQDAAPGADFVAEPEPALIDGVGIAIDADDRLYVADRARRHIAVIDLWSRRTLRTVRLATTGAPLRHPMGLAAHDRVVYAVVRGPAGLLRLTATRGPDELPPAAGVDDLPAGSEPSRVTVLDDGTPAVLWHAPDGAGWIIAGSRPAFRVGSASDIVVGTDGVLVLAPCPPAGPNAAVTLHRLAPTASGWTRALPLDATGYDGSGLVVTEDGRIGYWTAAGFRLAVGRRVEHERKGVCVTYRFDAGVPRNRWGRILLDACIPPGTACAVAAATTDDEYATALPHGAAEPAACVAVVPSATPALPPSELELTDAEIAGGLHRRRDTTTPWWRPAAGDPVELFEAPVVAPPGRYLWLTFLLRGDGRSTPAIREVRVEHEGHDLMRRLPELYSGEDGGLGGPSFLHRYLALFDGLLHDLDIRAACRDLLLDPASTPVEVLPWLASFVGLLLDNRWAEQARRQLVAEIVPLYRRRGTVWALRRYAELFLMGERADAETRPGVAPIVIEHFRLRGLGGPLLGGDPHTSSRSVVGHGFRVGGEVGTLEGGPIDPSEDATSSFASHAHRFSVLVTRPLSPEQEGALRHIFETERPVHTDYALCTVDAGMRVGHGLHAGISTIVGPTAGFDAAVADASLLGRGTLLGGRVTGIAVEAARVGTDTRVG